MALDTTKMGLHVWNQPLDPYDYIQLAKDWNILDFHDHTPGRGTQVPMGGIAPGAVGPVQLASNVPLVPTGGVVLWTTSTAPSGYLLCDGTAYQQSLYPALYAIVGSSFANSPPGGYFNVPQLTGPTPSHGGPINYIIKT